ncbi:MAG: M61 family metallopeptidase [Ardenticatenales bacterium]|nr:M61 family metallopeptidase [Ardenticatenales bacterium]
MTTQIHYTLAMTRPETHRFEVTLEVRGANTPYIDLTLPVWTPGSYLVREFARHVEQFHAETSDGNPLSWTRLNKGCWRIHLPMSREFRVRYEVYANDLSVRTSHLDTTHGYFNGANLFMYLDGFKEQPVTLEIQAPPGWHASIALPQNGQGWYEAESYDLLVDSPGEVGTHRVLRFEALGKPHEVALWGSGNEDEATLVRDLKQIVEGVAQMFEGQLPYERYLFIVHLGDRLGGGLEHRNSTTLAVDRWSFFPYSEYEKFLRLAVHEFFHVWLVKRIRPHNLGPFDYTQEVYTPLLWVMEGFTTYYDVMLLRRLGLVTTQRCLDLLAERIAAYRLQPGRLIQSLEESSLTAWIKFYRQDENYVNSGISYYLKGGLVALMLDLHLRLSSQNKHSLDDVVCQLWAQYGQRDVGFTPEEFLAVLAEIGGPEMEGYLGRFARGMEELPLEAFLSAAGLELEGRCTDEMLPVWTGLSLKQEAGKLIVKHVLRDSPAERAGIMANDQLVALNGYQLTEEKFLTARLKEQRPGNTITLHLFRYAMLTETHLTLAPAPCDSALLRPIKNPTSLQRHILESWLKALGER